MASGQRAYIGTKVVRAWPKKAPKDVKGNNKPGDPGYAVKYEDGYISWSPKETFERAYRPITAAEKAMI